jgi:hypothetical protein
MAKQPEYLVQVTSLLCHTFAPFVGQGPVTNLNYRLIIVVLAGIAPNMEKHITGSTRELCTVVPTCASLFLEGPPIHITNKQ